MDWTAIGAIGETLGAVAVLATLFYLAAQIRQSATSTRTASELHVTKMIEGWVGEMSGDEHFQGIWEKISNGEHLEFLEQRRYIWWLVRYGAIAQGVYDQYEAGMVSSRCWNNVERSLVGLLQPEFARMWWDNRDGNFSPALYDYIDPLLSKSPTWIPQGADKYAKT